MFSDSQRPEQGSGITMLRDFVKQRGNGAAVDHSWYEQTNHKLCTTFSARPLVRGIHGFGYKYTQTRSLLVVECSSFVKTVAKATDTPDMRELTPSTRVLRKMGAEVDR